MKKGTIPAVLLLLGGIAMLVFVVRFVMPAAEYNAKVCTLEVEAVVVDNKSYHDEDRGFYYKQVVEYTVEGTTCRAAVGGSASDPVEPGTVMKLWVDPEHRSRFTTTRDANSVSITSVAIPAIIVIFALLGVITSRRKR